jgi:hypothetical protein
MIIASCDPSLLTPHLPPSRSTFAWGVNSESGAFARGREGAIERSARIVRWVFSYPEPALSEPRRLRHLGLHRQP